jgi:hypothetical protein
MPSRGEAYPGEFPSLGPQIVIRIEDYLIHGPGDVMGEPIVLDDEFYEFVVRAYRIDPETGRRRYSPGVPVPGQGSGEIELDGHAGLRRGARPGAVRRLGRQRRAGRSPGEVAVHSVRGHRGGPGR